MTGYPNIEKRIFTDIRTIKRMDMMTYDLFEPGFQEAQRLLKTVGLLEEGSYIGIQISFEEEGSGLSTVIFSDNPRITDDDYNWIFKGIGRVHDSEDASINFPAGNLYTIGMEKGDDDETNSYPKSMLEILRERKNTTLYIIVKKKQGVQDSRVSVLLSAAEMSLSFETAACLSVENGRVDRVKKSETLDSLTEIPKDKSHNVLRGFLGATALLKGHSDNEESIASENRSDEEPVPTAQTEKKNSEEVKLNPDGTVPLEALNLSVRSFNILRRGGFSSLESVEKISDAEIMKLRYMTPKSLSEIRRAIAQYRLKTNGITPEYTSEIDSMIGLENIKKQIRVYRALARMKKSMEGSGRKLDLSLNMQFVGPPGTAKTTVARLLADILYREGLISNRNPIEVGRSDLVGEHVGHTAAKVSRVFKDAKGKLLFIDEAYALAEESRGYFGDEAINQIVQELDNNRDTVVIFAGYKKEMENLFKINPGLRSRVPNKFEFKSYSIDELVEITVSIAKKSGFNIHSSAVKRIREICEQASKAENFGNGRFCRSLVEGAISAFALRCYSGNTVPQTAKKPLLLSKDFSMPTSIIEYQPKKTIGFTAL